MVLNCYRCFHKLQDDIVSLILLTCRGPTRRELFAVELLIEDRLAINLCAVATSEIACGHVAIVQAELGKRTTQSKEQAPGQ